MRLYCTIIVEMGFPTGSPIGLYCTSTVSLPLRCFFSFSEVIVTHYLLLRDIPYRVFLMTLLCYYFKNLIFLQGVP